MFSIVYDVDRHILDVMAFARDFENTRIANGIQSAARGLDLNLGLNPCFLHGPKNFSN